MFEIKPPIGAAEINWFENLPGWQPLGQAFIRLWWVFLAMGLAAGLAWRFSGAAPKLFDTLDAVGIVLCLGAPFLAMPWISLSWRQTLHQNMGGTMFALKLFSAFKVLGASALLALAFTGVLLAYDPAVPVARVLTLEMLDFKIPLGLFVPAMLILIAPICLVLSSVVLLAAMRYAGAKVGPVVWVAFVALLHTRFNVVSEPLGIEPGQGLQLSLGTIAITCRDFLNRVNADPTKGLYLSDIGINMLVVRLSALCIATLLLVIVPCRALSTKTRLDVPLISAIGAVIVVACRYLSKIGSQLASAEALAQSDWLEMLALGLLTMMALNLVLGAAGFAGHKASYRLRAVFVFLLTIPFWPQFTSAAILSGRASHLDVLIALGICFLAGSAWVILVDLMLMFRESSKFLGTAAFVVLAIALVVPVSNQGSATPFVLLQGIYGAFKSSEQAGYAYVLAGCMLAVVVIGLLMGIKRGASQKQRL